MTRRDRMWMMVRAATFGVAASVLVACDVPVKEMSEPFNLAILNKKQDQQKFDHLKNLITTLRTTEGVLPYVIEATGQGEYSIRRTVDSLLQEKLREITSDSDFHQNAAALIDAEIDKRNDLLLTKTAQLGGLPAENLSKRLGLIDEIFILNGNAELRAKNREDSLHAASQQAFAWLAEKQYDKASPIFEMLIDQGDDSQDVKDGFSQATFNLQLLQLERHREQGDVDSVYQTFLQMINNPVNKPFVDQLQPSALDLAGYFSLLAQNSMLTGDLLETYRNLQKITNITNLISLPSLDRTVEQDFISQIFVLAEGARNDGHLGMAIAYLEIMEDFDAPYAEAKRTLNDLRRQLYDRAIVKMATFPFDSPLNTPGLGALISATLIQHFTDARYMDIRILERQSLDDVLKEQQIRSMADGREINVSASDYLIHGAVVEANVDTTIQESRLTKRVLVDVKRTPNPEYENWRKMTRQQRLKVRTPPAFLMEDVKENISTTQTRYSKLASVISNYRIVDSGNSELLHTRTLNLERTFEDESREGIEIGRYVQKVKLASLPADTKILRDLARLHAEEIALDIVAQLQNPERRYLDAANGLKADGQMKAAAQELAKAVMILEAKKKPIDEEMKNLKQLALQVK